MQIHSFVTPFSGIGATNLVAAAGVALAAYVIMHAAVALFRRRLCKLSDDSHADRPLAELLKATLASTSKIALIVTAVLIGLTVLQLPAPWDERVRHLWFIALGAQLALYLDRAVSVLGHRYFRNHAHDPQAPATVAQTLMVWAVKTGLWVIFALAMLSNLGINVSTFIASLGIGGIAVALAVQNILGDLFASLSIAVDKPFEVGDAISVDGVSGNVEHVGLKTTRIRADSGEQIVIANAELLKNTLRNFKRMTTRRVQLALSVNPSTPPDLAGRVPGMLRDIISQQKGVRFDRAHLKRIGPDALEYEAVFHVLDPSYDLYMNSQQAVLLAAMQALEEMGVSTLGAPQHLVLERRSDRVPGLKAPASAGVLRKVVAARGV